MLRQHLLLVCYHERIETLAYLAGRFVACGLLRFIRIFLLGQAVERGYSLRLLLHLHHEALVICEI